jgi:hypothetical protein
MTRLPLNPTRGRLPNRLARRIPPGRKARPLVIPCLGGSPEGSPSRHDMLKPACRKARQEPHPPSTPLGITLCVMAFSPGRIRSRSGISLRSPEFMAVLMNFFHRRDNIIHIFLTAQQLPMFQPDRFPAGFLRVRTKRAKSRVIDGDAIVLA